MSYIPTPEQAEELVKRYNKEPFHIQHAETVSKVMGELAKEFDPERADFWAAVGTVSRQTSFCMSLTLTRT